MPTFKNKSEVNDLLVKSRHYEVLRPKIDWKLCYNVISAIKGLCLEGEERTTRMKRFRLLLIHVAGRMNRNNCLMGLRVCNNAAALKRMQAVWRVFELPTQATSAKTPVLRRFRSNRLRNQPPFRLGCTNCLKYALASDAMWT